LNIFEQGGLFMDSGMDYVLQGLFLGAVVAVIAVGYNKLVIGKFIKALLKAEANHPAFAKSFGDLNVRENIFIKFALRNGGSLKKIITKLETEETGDVIKYYIPEEKLYRAGRIYGGKDVDILLLAAIIVVLFLFFGIILIYLPALLNFVQDLLPFDLSDIGGGAK
jgi:hypothetical protein